MDGRLVGVDLPKLRRRASSQLGLFTRAQAVECGVSADQIWRRVKVGDWQRVLGKVLAPAELRLTAAVRDRAAALAVPGGVLAAASAARAWACPVPDQRIYLAVGPGRHPRIEGIRYLRFVVPRRELTRWEGALVTTARRAVLDCLTLLPASDAQELLDRALNKGLVAVDDLSTFVASNLNRRGMRQMRRLIARIAGGSRFEAERLAARLLKEAGITGWQANLEIHDEAGLVGVADIAFAAARLLIEIDGRAFHTTTAQFQRDRHRQNRLINAGWSVLRFTWLDLTERPEYVIATIRHALGRQISH